MILSPPTLRARRCLHHNHDLYTIAAGSGRDIEGAAISAWWQRKSGKMMRSAGGRRRVHGLIAIRSAARRIEPV